MSAKRIIEAVKLPTLSKTLLDIMEVEKLNPISFLDDIKRIVSKDPLFSAHLLLVANSSFYGFTQKIRTISHAIGLLGVRKVKDLAFSFSLFDFLKKINYKSSYGETFNLILKKSLLISAIATMLAKKINYLDAEELYTSGLMAEIGELILFLYSPDQYCRIYSIHDRELLLKEKEIFFTDHVALGIEFCERYGFPVFIKTAVENHARLCSDDEHSRISFVSARIAELLLTENEEERSGIFKEIENHTKRLLRLPLSEVEAVINGLPHIMEAFNADFPEVQKDLQKIIETGSSIIMKLMKKEMEMVILTQELTDSQKKMAREKIFLSHMLNLSYFFSSLAPPLKTISSLFEYFENFISEFTIEFIYRYPGAEGGHYRRITNKNDMEGTPIDIDRFSGLLKAKIANEVVRLDDEDTQCLDKSPATISLVFPVSFHPSFFGFLILDVESNAYIELDLEMSYVQILSNIIANSFQNYLSIENLKNETNKKKLVTRELFEADKELNRSRENLIELQKSEVVKELLPVIFHKLKNKLTPILGYSQILLAKIKDTTIIERLKKIEKNANELANQLNVLRDYFKTEKVDMVKENLNHIVNRLRPYFCQIGASQDLEIVLDLDDGVAEDRLNPGQIETLLTNMVNNSALAIKQKAARETVKGRIEIKTAALQDEYKLIIRDNGIGIKEENIAKIWAPFYSDFPDEAGIGLSICEKIISNHKASCLVQSKEGEFSQFEITFNKKPMETVGEYPEVSLQRREKGLHGKILIVDDEVYLLDLMKEILLSKGDFEILTTTSGREAIELLSKDNHFDLVISDIRMPGVDGMQVYNFLKAERMGTRIILVTADTYSEDVAQFLKNNRVKFLKKPFELMKFKQHVLEELSLCNNV
jgi:HD-like signal output (HDOD) protein/signal transduction histidine kinase